MAYGNYNPRYRNVWDIFDEENLQRNKQIADYGGDFGRGWAAGTGMMNDIAGAMRERQALKEARDIARGKNNSGQTPQGGIGVDANGVYGVPSQPSGGIGADANGVYGVNGTPQPNKYTFNESDYIPSAQNGYHLGNYPQTEMYGSPTDFQRQMASNAIGYNLGSFEPRGQTWFPKQNGFGQAINNAENPLNSFTGGSVSNFLNPVSFDNSAQVDGGAVKQGANDYLDDRYSRLNYLRDRINAGSRNPFVSATVYDTLIAPIKEEIKEGELRNAFRIIQTADPKSQEYNDAVSLIQYYKKDPYMAENQDWSREERNMKKKRFGWDEEMFEARKANGFLPLRGGGRVGRPSGSGNSVGRTPKIKGFDQSLLDEDMIDSLKSFKADSTSAENFDNMIGNMRALKARLMQERGLSDEEAGAFVGSVLKKSLGTTYYKLPQKQKTFLMNSFNGIDSYGEKPTAPERKLAGQGYLDAIKKAAGEKFDRLIENGKMKSYEDNQPSGAVIDGVYYSDQTLENLAKEKARLEQAVKDGTFGYYGENGFGAMPKGESTRLAQELQNEDVLDGIEETDRWKEALRSLI